MVISIYEGSFHWNDLKDLHQFRKYLRQWQEMMCYQFCWVSLQAASIWLFIASISMRKILGWIRECYNNPPLIVTENGEVFQHQNVLMTKTKKKPKTKNQPTNQPTILHNNIAIMHNMEEEFIKCFSFSKTCWYVTPWSLLCCWDSNVLIYDVITGVDEANSDDSLSLSKELEDYHHIDYHHDYMQNMLLAIRYNLNLNEVLSIFILICQTDLDVQTVVKQISKIEIMHFILLKLLISFMNKQHHNKTVPLIFSCIRPPPENWYHKIRLLLHPPVWCTANKNSSNFQGN